MHLYELLNCTPNTSFQEDGDVSAQKVKEILVFLIAGEIISEQLKLSSV